MIAVLVRQQDAIELIGSDTALSHPHGQLAGAQSAIDQNPAMIGRNECAIPRAAAAEHREAKHIALLTERVGVHKWKCVAADGHSERSRGTPSR